MSEAQAARAQIMTTQGRSGRKRCEAATLGRKNAPIASLDADARTGDADV